MGVFAIGLGVFLFPLLGGKDALVLELDGGASRFPMFLAAAVRVAAAEGDLRALLLCWGREGFDTR